MMNILLIGPQGSGKGTQAEYLVREFHLIHVETGSMIRKRALIHDRKADLVDHLANQKGVLLPDGIVIGMIMDEMTERPSGTGYLFDGFPRTVTQYEALMDIFTDKHMRLTAAIYLSLPDDEAIRRIRCRRVCSICKRGYSASLEPGRTACECGGQLVTRPDDDPDTLARRLSAFHERTEPILALLRKEGLLQEINGAQPADAVFEDIKRHLQYTV